MMLKVFGDCIIFLTQIVFAWMVHAAGMCFFEKVETCQVANLNEFRGCQKILYQSVPPPCATEVGVWNVGGET